MSKFTLKLYSGKSFKGEITRANVLEDRKQYNTLYANSTLTRYKGSCSYENKEGFLSVDVEVDPATNNINSIDVLITNIDINDNSVIKDLEEDVGTQLVIEDYILKNLSI